MAIFDDLTEQEIKQNKAIRGYIVRALAKGSNNSLLVRQITNALLADNLITVPVSASDKMKENAEEKM